MWHSHPFLLILLCIFDLSLGVGYEIVVFYVFLGEILDLHFGYYYFILEGLNPNSI
jgi:hypothetical protein